MSQEISIKLNIAERIYPLRIQSHEEEGIRRSAKLINDKLKEYRDQYAVEDKQDLLAMCVLHFVTELEKASKNSNQSEAGIAESLEEIENLLSKTLS